MSPAPASSSSTSALSLRIVAECATTKARAAVMRLPHADVDTPVFMPVGTQVELWFTLYRMAHRKWKETKQQPGTA